MKRYYNAVVLCNDGKRIKYHNVTNLRDFVNYARNNLRFRTIMFYSKTHYKNKQGNYCGFYSMRRGLVTYL